MKAKLVLALIFVTCLMPLLTMLFYFKINFDILSFELLSALKNSMFQSVSAALICLTVSMLLAPGLAKNNNRWLTPLSKLSLLPSILPSIFTLLITFSFFNNFPFGHIGIIVVFVFMYLGFSTVALSNAYALAVRKHLSVISIYQISWYDRHIKIYLPLMYKDILNIFFVIILSCLTSLSVPLLAGGGRGSNIELLVYESIYINGNWASAVVATLLQLGIISCLSLYLNRKSSDVKSQNYSFIWNQKKINTSFIIFFTYVAFFILGYLYQVLKSLFTVNFHQLNLTSFISPLMHSLGLAIFSIFLFLLLCFGLFYLDYQKINYEKLFYFMMPSTSLIGFALYLIFSNFSDAAFDILKVGLGIHFICSLALYKSYISSAVSQIRTSLEVAKIYNISFLEVLKKIILPYCVKPMLICVNILFIVSFCEFALIKTVGVQTLFSGAFIERLISSYRLDFGFIYSFIVLMVCAMFFQITRSLNVKN